MKPQTWAIVFLAVIIAGCSPRLRSVAAGAASDKNPPGSNLSRACENAGDEVIDEDFDLLAEQLDEQTVKIADPLEPFNRLMYGINDILYFWAVKPVAQTYEAVIPKPVRLGIRNFFNNITTPIRLANCLLQGKGAAAGTEWDRFIINTTAGVLGFGDPARDQYGIEPAAEDLGQTLAVHGLGNGFYLVLPLLGPSTVRDSVGLAGEVFLHPLFYVEPAETALAISAGWHVNESSFHIGEYEAFKSAAIDPYIAMRNAYIQYRNKQIEQ